MNPPLERVIIYIREPRKDVRIAACWWNFKDRLKGSPTPTRRADSPWSGKEFQKRMKALLSHPESIRRMDVDKAITWGLTEALHHIA
jgi:hypothetical protein